ncbi:MAG: hypothetical protein N839_0003935 [Desulfofustis sp. PB-SRB1]|jgi:putative sterol carrier protein|nr:hypothetical protein [Desulfofustis sp. PB-SRB1]MBM1001544.1 hypothetical protein [Desulfofustis sp. PB-SRB1]
MMLEEIFAELPSIYQLNSVNKETSFYFTLGDCKKTVRLSADTCRVEDGKTTDNADCVCKTTPEFFTAIWMDGYRPSMGDFLSGKIKTNNPDGLRTFLAAFGKSP